MKKKIIALIAVVFAFFGITVSLTTVNAAENDYTESTINIKRNYYYNFNDTLSTTMSANAYEYEKSSFAITLATAAAKSTMSSVTTESINPSDKREKTFTSALKLDSKETISWTTTNNWEMTIKYVATNSNTSFKINNVESSAISTTAGSVYTYNVSGTGSTASSQFTFSKGDGETSILEMVITIIEQRTITAKTYAQTGHKDLTEGRTHYLRFITIVNGVNSIDDLADVKYSYTYGTQTLERTPHVVDIIYDKNPNIYESSIDGTNYSFSNKDDVKYLIYTIAYKNENTTSGNKYTGTLSLKVILGNLTISSKDETLS